MKKNIKYNKRGKIRINNSTTHSEKLFSKSILNSSFNHKPKKSLGQNFLKSKEALLKMCDAGKVVDTDIIIEIGPGKGALTEKLLEKAKKVIAIEKDSDLYQFLLEKFVTEINENKLVLLNQDILEFETNNKELKNQNYKIVANIPYNITGLIIRKFLTNINKPKAMVLLVQKEVAERIVARNNKESILSLSVKAYGNPKYIMKVSKKYFSPSPKVDSAIISIHDISGALFKNKFMEDFYFTLIKASFAHKRKVLRKNLLDIEKNQNKIDGILSELEIVANSRAEDISFSKWILLNKFFSNL